jgi:putative ABC transport system permease protein
MILYNAKSNCIAMKVALHGKAGSTLAGAEHKIETAWKIVYPERKIEFKFLDDTIKRFYEPELRSGRIMLVATGVAIIISCLGLLALSSFTVHQRKKEISIRKVVGASVNSIVVLLSRGLLKHVIIAFFISIPCAYYVVSLWLQDFAYRNELGVSIFIVSIVISVCAAFLTVSFQTIKTARSNPVKFLRYE